MKYDPHDDSFIAKNLREEEWFVYQKDERTNSLAESIKGAFILGYLAKIKNSVLYELGIDISMRAGTPAVLIQPPWDGSHWAGIALCMLTKAYMEPSESEKVIRFSKSPYSQEPMYWNNIEWVEEIGRTSLVPRRKKIIKTTIEPKQENLFDF